MERTYRTKEETVAYFELLARGFERDASQAEKIGDIAAASFFRGKAEAYEVAAFEVENNMGI